ncbi:MAG: alpha/beta fold hydrolase [Chitinophagales bacterium]
MQLNYKKLGESGSTILILHGLLGSLDNWQTIAKQLAETHQVYIIDQRNHGRSPHSEIFSYEILAQDILDFCAEHTIEKTTIIGHSMGGKVAMLLALLHPEIIEKLIVADIAPTHYDGGHEEILFAMAEAPIHATTDRNDIDVFLQKRIPEFSVRQFVLKNLSRNTDGKFEWKCDLETLINNYRVLMEFPAVETIFSGETYFIKGAQSNYITTENWNSCLHYFPNAKLLSVANAGHWLHAENPLEFVEKIKSIVYVAR